MELTYIETRLWEVLEPRADANSRKAKLALET